MIRSLASSVLARLRSDPALLVFDGEAVNVPANSGYVLVYFNAGARRSDRFTGPSNTALVNITVHSVGRNPDQARLIQEKVFNLLVDWTPIVAGRNPHRLRHEVSLPVRVDRDSDAHLWFGVDQFDAFVT